MFREVNAWMHFCPTDTKATKTTKVRPDQAPRHRSPSPSTVASAHNVKQTLKFRNTRRHTTQGRKGAGEGYIKKNRVIFVWISKLNFWAYLSSSDLMFVTKQPRKILKHNQKRTNYERDPLERGRGWI